jgi:hypothetical protein
VGKATPCAPIPRRRALLCRSLSSLRFAAYAGLPFSHLLNKRAVFCEQVVVESTFAAQSCAAWSGRRRAPIDPFLDWMSCKSATPIRRDATHDLITLLLSEGCYWPWTVMRSTGVPSWVCVALCVTSKTPTSWGDAERNRDVGARHGVRQPRCQRFCLFWRMGAVLQTDDQMEMAF